jgi:SAM-dependent methyltransferase
MTGDFSSTWLSLREPADAAARSAEAAGELTDRLRPPLVIRDLGCGTGSMARWLAPRLPGPQHWILQDRDPALLAYAAAALPDGVTGEARTGDVTALTGADLAGTALVTCSALLDLLTAGEVAALAAACAVHGTPALFTLSVTGEVRFDPADPLDPEVAAAFDAHQRRTVGGRRLLGPDAGAVAATAFRDVGATVTLRDSPWSLEPDDPLTAEWFTGWVAAARDQRPDLRLDDYERRRAAGRSRVSVGHVDLLAQFD